MNISLVVSKRDPIMAATPTTMMGSPGNVAPLQVMLHLGSSEVAITDPAMTTAPAITVPPLHGPPKAAVPTMVMVLKVDMLPQALHLVLRLGNSKLPLVARLLPTDTEGTEDMEDTGMLLRVLLLDRLHLHPLECRRCMVVLEVLHPRHLLAMSLRHPLLVTNLRHLLRRKERFALVDAISILEKLV